MTPPGRQPELDALRGIMASFVVLSHVSAMTYFPWPAATMPTPTEYLLWHLGAPAVDFFLVLSAYVVTLSLLHRPAWRPYLISRAWRLVPMSLWGILLGLTLARPGALLAPDASSSLITTSLRAALNQADWHGLLSAGLTRFDANHLNPPLWTLTLEMQFALLMPLLIWLARLGWWTLLPAMILGLTLGLKVNPNLWYLPVFLLGTLLAVHPPRLPRRLRYPALLLGGLLLFERHLSGSESDWIRWWAALGAALVILSVQQGSLPWLNAAWLRGLGERSFSLYATHFPVMVVFVALLGHDLGVTFSALLSLPAVALMATFTHRFIEQPTLKRSKAARKAQDQQPSPPGGGTQEPQSPVISGGQT